jgi:hypothetical protein
MKHRARSEEQRAEKKIKRKKERKGWQGSLGAFLASVHKCQSRLSWDVANLE